MIDMLVTEHFRLTEFASHDSQLYPAEWIETRLRPLCAVLEQIRQACGGRPLTILSGYRSPAHNIAVGGAKLSQHVQGRAADITVDGLTPSDVHSTTLSLFNLGVIEIGGLGIYPSWVHVDIRPRPADGHLARWAGKGVGAEK